jgi:hypothetical protein
LDGAVGSQLPVTMLIVAVSPTLSRKVTVDFSAFVKRWKIESARTQKFDLDCRFYRLDAPSFQEKLALVFSASRERVGWNSPRARRHATESLAPSPELWRWSSFRRYYFGEPGPVKSVNRFPPAVP